MHPLIIPVDVLSYDRYYHVIYTELQILHGRISFLRSWYW